MLTSSCNVFNFSHKFTAYLTCWRIGKNRFIVSKTHLSFLKEIYINMLRKKNKKKNIMPLWIAAKYIDYVTYDIVTVYHILNAQIPLKMQI